MSLLVQTDIQCDFCGDWTYGEVSYKVQARKARRRAAKDGWKWAKVGADSKSSKGEMADVCPICAKQYRST